MSFKDPDKQRAAVRECQRKRRLTEKAARGGKTKTCSALVPYRMETARDVIALLRDQANEVLADASVSTIEGARVIATLCSVILRGFEQQDLVERIEALEARMAEGRQAA